MGDRTNPRTITTIAVFAAVAVFLNLSPLKIPAPYAPFLIYQIWEVPIVAAFLLYGPKVGVLISLINTLILLVVFPGALPTGPFYNLAATLSMLLGIYGFHRITSWDSNKHREMLYVIASTAAGVATRVALMTVFNSMLLPEPPPIGFSMPVPVMLAALPLIVVFNATLALYTIPLGYFVTKAIVSNITVAPWYVRTPAKRPKFA